MGPSLARWNRSRPNWVLSAGRCIGGYARPMQGLRNGCANRTEIDAGASQKHLELCKVYRNQDNSLPSGGACDATLLNQQPGVHQMPAGLLLLRISCLPHAERGFSSFPGFPCDTRRLIRESKGWTCLVLNSRSRSVAMDHDGSARASCSWQSIHCVSSTPSAACSCQRPW